MNQTTDIVNDYVLVVDDDLDLAQMLVMFVQSSGRSARQALDFNEFEALCAQRMPTALLLDLIMPDDCSTRIGHWLAEKHPTLPVALVSSVSLGELQQRAQWLRDLGMRSISTLRKPFWPQDIAALLNTMGGVDVASTADPEGKT